MKIERRRCIVLYYLAKRRMQRRANRYRIEFTKEKQRYIVSVSFYASSKSRLCSLGPARLANHLAIFQTLFSIWSYPWIYIDTQRLTLVEALEISGRKNTLYLACPFNQMAMSIVICNEEVGLGWDFGLISERKGVDATMFATAAEQA